ncbi:hypothetical protein D3C75_1187150 [compost metagenome]
MAVPGQLLNRGLHRHLIVQQQALGRDPFDQPVHEHQRVFRFDQLHVGCGLIAGREDNQAIHLAGNQGFHIGILLIRILIRIADADLNPMTLQFILNRPDTLDGQ